MIYSSKKLKRFAKGDLFNVDTTNSYSVAGNIGAGIINNFNKKDQFGAADNSALDALGGALSGASTGAMFGPLGAGIGGGIGLISSIFGQEDAQKKRELAKAKEDFSIKENSVSRLQKYNSYGLPQGKYGMRFNSNELPSPTDDSEVENLASNVAQYSGNTHENGGIDLDTDQDGSPNIEVEDEEVIKDNMVLSDRLTPSESVMEYLKHLKLNKNPKDSYASVAERLGRKKGNWEAKLESNNAGEKEAARRMIAKYDEAINSLFEDQQAQKEETDMKKYKMAYGGVVDPNKPKISKITNQPYKDEVEYTREQYEKGQIPANEEYVISYFKRNPTTKRVLSGTAISDGNEFPNQVVDAFTDEYNKSKQMNPYGGTAMYDSQGQLPVSDSNYIYKKPGQEKIFKKFGGYYAGGGKFKNFLQDNSGNLTALAGGLGNQAFINNLNTNIEPDRSPDPTPIYTDRTNTIKNNINERYRTATKGLDQSSAATNLALKSGLFADSLNSMNNALDQETQRKDGLSQQFQQLLQNNRQFNTQYSNYFKNISFDNNNQKTALSQSNFDNTVRSFMGNKTQKDLQDLDFAKTFLNTRTGDTGVDERFFNSLPENTDNKFLNSLKKFGNYKKKKVITE